MDSALRPMSASQVLDRTFYLYRNNFWLFAGIALITPVLTTLVSLAQLAAFGLPVMIDPVKADPQMVQRYMQDTIMRAVIGGTLGLAVYAIGYAFSSGATVYAVSMLHLGKSTTIRDSYARIKPIFGRILWLIVSIFLISGGPLMASYLLFFGFVFAVPSMMKSGAASGGPVLMLGGLLTLSAAMFGAFFWFFYSYCRYALAVAACTIENLPAKFSRIRSKFLVRGNMGRLLGVYFLTLLIAVAVKGVLQFPAFFASGIFSMRPGQHMSSGFLVWLYFSEFIGTMIAGPIATIAMALVYYDERVRKEAFDLQLMMEALGQPDTPSPPATTFPASPASA